MFQWTNFSWKLCEFRGGEEDFSAYLHCPKTRTSTDHAGIIFHCCRTPGHNSTERQAEQLSGGGAAPKGGGCPGSVPAHNICVRERGMGVFGAGVLVNLGKFKGTVAPDLFDSFFSWINSIWAPDSFPKIIFISVSNLPGYLNLNLTLRWIMQWGVNKKKLRWESFHGCFL